MNEHFYICRVWCDPKSWKSRFSYVSNSYGWCKTFGDAKSFPTREIANNHLNGRSGTIWPEAELKASAYYLQEMKNEPAKTVSLEVLPPAKCAIVAHLKTGDDASAAKQLNKLFADAQTGMRRVVALGLYAWEIKETKLKHGEWGPWLAAHCPKLAAVDSVTGHAKPSRALSGYMELTKNVLEACGVPTINKYLATVAKFANDANLKPGQFLLIADKKVPDNVRPMREKICELVDGKTQRALFLEFKQADDDTGKPKVGRMKGSSGLTKAQRENAAARAEAARLVELEEETAETSKWLLENSDAKNLGLLDAKVLLKLRDACLTCAGFVDRVAAARQTPAK